MRILLDTHALLWALTAPGRLGTAATTALTDRQTHIVVSAASAWEIATKHRLGKLPQADALMGAYPHHLDRLGAERLPVAEEHALLSGRLEWAHGDPFDRMLAAQAMTESIPLVTNDPAFESLPSVARIW